MNAQLLDEYRYQRRHGSPAAEVCLRQAKAYLLLQEAIARGVAEVDWIEDTDFTADDAQCCEECRENFESGWVEALRCVLWIRGEPAASVGPVLMQSIGPDPYGRIAESELAWECEEALRDAIRGGL
jgi:hypothetical protein